MVKLHSIFVFFLPVLLVVTACNSNLSTTRVEPEALALTNDYGISYQCWTAGKQKHGNSYWYTVRQSSWVGFNSTTTITVRKGNVVSRSFITDTLDHQTGKAIIVRGWTEDVNNLNAHNEGAAATSLDVIYQHCTQQWLSVNKNENTVYFEGNHGGILSLCGYAPRNCADDCFIGVNINEFEWLE